MVKSRLLSVGLESDDFPELSPQLSLCPTTGEFWWQQVSACLLHLLSRIWLYSFSPLSSLHEEIIQDFPHPWRWTEAILGWVVITDFNQVRQTSVMKSEIETSGGVERRVRVGYTNIAARMSLNHCYRYDRHATCGPFKISFCSFFQITSRIIPTYTDACRCLTVDSDNIHLLHIPPADKCMWVNGNRTGLVIMFVLQIPVQSAYQVEQSQSLV